MGLAQRRHRRPWPRILRGTVVFISTDWLHIAWHAPVGWRRFWFFSLQRPSRWRVLVVLLCGLEIALPAAFRREFD